MPDSFRPASLAIVCWIAACVIASAQEAPVLDSETKKSGSGIGIRKLAERYEIQNATSNEKLRLVDHPVLSWTNPERNTSAGALFLWTLQSRPQAAMCIYPTGPNDFDHEFQSLCEEPIKASESGVVLWSPQTPGLKWQDLPYEPTTTASSSSRRLLSMRRLAGEFSAQLIPPNRASKPLRLLTTPVYRYEPNELSDEIIDGALFTFVLGTDPEILLLVENYKTDDKTNKWRVAFARMTMVPVELKHNASVIWEERDWAPHGFNLPRNIIKQAGSGSNQESP